MYHMIMKSKEIGALQINSATTLVQFETNVLKIRGLCKNFIMLFFLQVLDGDRGTLNAEFMQLD